MATQKKIEIVEDYTQKFKQSKSIFLTDYSGINVAEATELRRSFRDANAEYRILKNNLAKRSFKNAGIEGVEEMLQGMTAFAFSDNDAVAPIKVIKDFNKKLASKKKSLKIKGCIFEGEILNADQADALAKLPSRDVLISQFVGLLQSPLSKLVGVLQASGQKLAGVLESVKNQKQS